MSKVVFQVFFTIGVQSQSSVFGRNVILDLGTAVQLSCNTPHDDNVALWNITGNDNEQFEIYLPPIPLEAKKRGFVLETPLETDTVFVNKLTVLGSVENNQTEIKCAVSGRGSDIIVSYILTVIGNCSNIYV